MVVSCITLLSNLHDNYAYASISEWKGDGENTIAQKRKLLLAISFVVIFVFMTISPVLSSATDFPSGPDLKIGPNLDRVVWKVIGGENQLISALQVGEVDLHWGWIEATSAQILDANPDIEIVDDVLRNGYGHIVMDCRHPPYNWTAFRRAFAYAYDKVKVMADLFLGLSRLHDSYVPCVNELFCIEDELSYHYYNPEVAIGNAILDAAGFDINPVTGYRNDPNGNPIHVKISYNPVAQFIAGGCAQIGVDALEALHISAETNQLGFVDAKAKMQEHQPFDMIFFAIGFGHATGFGHTSGINVDWMERQFASWYIDEKFQNNCNFANETVDLYLKNLVEAKTYEEAKAASDEVQKILHYEQPYLVIYENIFLQAYRTDKFKGHMEDQMGYLASKWNLLNIINNDDTFGGTLSVQLEVAPNTFNWFWADSGYSIAILDLIWMGLFEVAPDMSLIPVLAENYTEEILGNGHHRFTFDIIQNATWSDGNPLTAEDVAFTFNYLYETRKLGNPSGAAYGDLFAAYAPTTYRAVIEYSRQNYWNFFKSLPAIIPKHIFEPGGPIGYEGWYTWNPGFNPSDPFVSCGPFTMTDMQGGEFYELTYNPLYAYYPQERLETPIETTTPGPTTAPPPFDASLAIAAGAVGAAVVILVGGFVLLKQK